MFTVMGARGHTGRKITELLLGSGEKVRALGRSKSKLSAMKSARLRSKGKGSHWPSHRSRLGEECKLLRIGWWLGGSRK